MELEVNMVNPKETALLVIDVQNDFVHEKGEIARSWKDMSHSQSMVPRLMNFIEAARRHKLPIIYTLATHSKWTDTATWRKRLPPGARVDEFCRPNTWGWDFYRLSPLSDELVIKKPRFSAFIGTQLELTLHALDVKNVLATGVATGGCVQLTAIHAFMLDFNVMVVSDCCADSSEATHQAALNWMGKFLSVNTAEEIQGIWAKMAVNV